MARTKGTEVMGLAELIKRVEGLTGPAAMTDRYIARMFQQEHTVPIPYYTASVDAVIHLIGEKMPGAEWALCGPPECHGRIYPTSWAEDGMDYSGKAPTPALALLLAFLRAWEARGKG